MTLFDAFFRMQSVRRRHNSAPFSLRRARFLSSLRRRGWKENALRQFASHLLQVNRVLGFKTTMRLVSMEELKRAARAMRRPCFIGPGHKPAPARRDAPESDYCADDMCGCQPVSAHPRFTRSPKIEDFEILKIRSVYFQQASETLKVPEASVHVGFVALVPIVSREVAASPVLEKLVPPNCHAFPLAGFAVIELLTVAIAAQKSPDGVPALGVMLGPVIVEEATVPLFVVTPLPSPAQVPPLPFRTS